MNKDYALLYSQKEGDFSKTLATRLFAFLKDRNYAVRSVLDLACGTGEFLAVMQNGCSDLVGIDFEPAMVEVAKRRAVDAKFEVRSIFDFDLGRQFDMVSANYETVNFALDKESLIKMFKNVARHLTDNGIFVFDFKTPLARTQKEFTFEEGLMFDYLKEVTTDGPLYDKHEIFYVASKDNYHKIVNNEKRCVWSVADIKEALVAAGFYNENWVTYELKVLKNPKKCDRVHVLCYKKKK